MVESLRFEKHFAEKYAELSPDYLTSLYIRAPEAYASNDSSNSNSSFNNSNFWLLHCCRKTFLSNLRCFLLYGSW